MHLILTGATGLVGSAVLDAMIKTKDITKISIISRRPVKMAEDAKDPRINVILHKDFEKYDSDLLNQLRGATGCVWALGISQNAVGKEEYVKITKDFPLAAAAAFQTLPSSGPSGPSSSPASSSPESQSQPQQPFRFIYVSGEGATTVPLDSQPLLSRLTNPWFAIIKGQTELSLSQLYSTPGTFLPWSMRPGFVDPSSHPAITPYIPKPPFLVNLAGCVLGPPIRAGYKKMWSPTEPLGKFLVEMAMGGWDETIRKEGETGGKGIEKLEGGGVVVSNEGWRRVAGLG
ncbi:hypothetical protein B0H65DRAFT_284950 [Neurospora tetraspora]|uniref:Nucleoside-diphosphate-sugar epimerase n=1 Tax=Neurospora tetraspora TaxID=94610 RepID=A0AAE0MP38_9PEZI|nr:hypothetical protein B0H65DRAFT_284950 [Neurospora tetraspora]